MRPAVTIPDELHEAVTRLAGDRGLSVDDAYAAALTRYVHEQQRRETEGQRAQELIEQVSRYCAEHDTALPSDIEAASLESHKRIEW